MKRPLIFLLLLCLCVISVSADVATDTITIDNTYWTAPDGVTTINVEVIGAGGSGGGGGHIYQIGSPSTYYLSWTGAGGLVGKANTYTNIDVVPGESYLVRIGLPGASANAVLTTCPASGSSYVDSTLASYTGFNGGLSSITINGTTYSSAGGNVGNTTISCNAGFMPELYKMNNWNVIGQTGYVVQYALALPGMNSNFGYGGSAGVGYGAGGGGGGKGNSSIDPLGGGGSSGVGAQGIVRISYYVDSATGVTQQGYPHYVTFKVVGWFGEPVENVTITATGINTSTGSFDFIPQLMGIPVNEVPIGTDAMIQSTDALGSSTFYMIPTVKYNLTFSKEGYTITPMLLVPQDDTYIIYASEPSFYTDGSNKLSGINISFSTANINSSYAFLNVTYNDTTSSTTGGTISIYKDSTSRVESGTVVASMPVESSSFTNGTLIVIPTGGGTYRVIVNSTVGDDVVLRYFAHTFKGTPVNIPGFTSETQLWLALFIIIFTAAFAGAVHSPQMSIVLCVEAWVFWAIGWLDALTTEFVYGESSIIGVLILASFLSIMWNVTEGKAKGKRSS